MEQPNQSYIKSLSAGNIEFEKKLIAVIKSEFPVEKETYLENLAATKYIETAENVHKLKHKISILGLEKSYSVAAQYENDLREGKTTLKDNFETILQTITDYLITL